MFPIRLYPVKKPERRRKAVSSKPYRFSFFDAFDQIFDIDTPIYELSRIALRPPSAYVHILRHLRFLSIRQVHLNDPHCVNPFFTLCFTNSSLSIWLVLLIESESFCISYIHLSYLYNLYSLVITNFG